MRTCIDCQIQMVTDHAWRKFTSQEKAELRAGGIYAHRGHGLCRLCYRRSVMPQRASRPVAHVAEDWAELVDKRLTQKENVRNLAPRLGMTEIALERAVLRAKRRGLLEVAA